MRVYSSCHSSWDRVTRMIFSHSKVCWAKTPAVCSPQTPGWAGYKTWEQCSVADADSFMTCLPWYWLSLSHFCYGKVPGSSISFYHLRNNPSLLVLSTPLALLRSSSCPHIACSSLLYELALQMFYAQLLCKSCARSGVSVLACSSSSKKRKSLPSSCMKEGEN